MPIETHCTGCGRQLQVADEHAGKQARCPRCNTIYTVPEKNSGGRPSFPTAKEEGGRAEDSWYLRTPEGQTYGPVARAELNRWVTEGRVTANCQLRAGDSNWRPAHQTFPDLKPNDTFGAGGANPFTDSDPYRVGPQGGYRPAAASQARQASYPAAHRGELILVFGILGWIVSCPILSVMAWVMGNSDLRQMEMGRMDPSGKSLTQAGRILGMILSVIWIAAFCMMLVWLLFMFALAAAGMAR